MQAEIFIINRTQGLTEQEKKELKNDYIAEHYADLATKSFNADDAFDKFTKEIETTVIDLKPIDSNSNRPGLQLLKIAAAVLLLAALSISLYILFSTDNYKFKTELATAEYALPDGSAILLNSNTVLDYDKDFGQNTRKVTLEGEAYFDIEHDANKPFSVKANGIEISVLGTRFMVRDYSTTENIKVILYEGRVTLNYGADNLQTLTMSPGDMVLLNKITGSVVNQFNIENLRNASFSKDKLEFIQDGLPDVINYLENLYNITIEIQDGLMVQEKNLTASFNRSNSIDNILQAIGNFTNTKVEKLNKSTYRLTE